MFVRDWPLRKTVVNLVALCAPFWILEIGFQIILHSVGSTTLSSWYVFAWQLYGTSFYTPYYFLGVELSTFHILLVFAFFGLFHIKDRRIILSLLVASLPVFLWPIFVSRIIYSQFLFVIPLALMGVYSVSEQKRRYLLPLPILCSLGLFLLAHGGSLFSLISK